MIKSFSSSVAPNDFVAKVTEALSTRELGKIVSMKTQENEIVISFNKLGKSDVVFVITEDNGGFKCTHKSEKIAMTHKMLRNDIEGKLVKILENLGAQVSNN